MSGTAAGEGEVTVVIGTAGHIDHGKSALVRALTGIDPDRLKEEIARGITIDLGFAHTREGDVQIALVDVPGHERFVRNMLAGAGGIDAVMLVVSAVESVKPQTREHFDICRLLAVDRGVIALTKTDLADAAAIHRAETDVRTLVAGSFLERAPVVRVSPVTGEGLSDLRQGLAALAGGHLRLGREGVVRLPVDRVFTVKGFGTVLTGTLTSGAMSVGDTLAVLPAGDDVRVRGLQVHGTPVERVTAPQRVAVNIAGVDASTLVRGVTLATRGAFAVTRRADVRLSLLEDASEIANGARVRVHQGTSESFARVSISASAAGPVSVPAGAAAFARLRFEKPVVLTRGDRLVLRGGSPVSTMGGAVVLDPEPAVGGIRRASALERFQQLNGGDAAVVSGVFLGDADAHGLTREAIIRRAGLTPAEAEQMRAQFEANGTARMIGDRMVSSVALAAFQARVVQQLTAFHRQHPRELGLSRETLRERAAGRAPAAVYEAVLAALARDGIVRAGDRVALVSHRADVPAADQELERATLECLRAAGLSPPDAAAIAEDLRVPPARVERALHALVRDGRAVKSGDIVFDREALDALRQAVAALRTDQAAGARVTLDVAAFKARHGLTRKYAIPLLEWLDRERITRRTGDVRVVL